jgi:ABC-type amino acid transport substrate-binding protein
VPAALRVLSVLVLCAWAALAPQRLGAQAPAAAPEAESDQKLSRRAVIRFLTEGDYPPFNYLDEDNVLTGFNVDMARAVCLELAAACDIQVRPWSELIPALRREFKGGPFGEPKYFGDGIGVVVGREDQQLKSLINAALKHIRTTGRYEELLLRYFPLRAF